MKPVKIKGFVPYYIHKVPRGIIIKPGDWEKYPEVFSGSYLSLDGELMISPRTDSTYRLTPVTMDSLVKFVKLFSWVEGDIKLILEKVKEYYEA